MKASWVMDRQNLRQHRAMVMVAEIMKRIDRYLGDDSQPGRISREIMEVMMEDGVEVLTDYARSELGLPPRDYKGWTSDEILALERRRLELPMAPMPIFIPIAEKKS